MRHLLYILACLALGWQLPINGQSGPPQCIYSIPANFFQQTIVVQALNLYRVEQNVWTPIYNSLQGVSQQVPSHVQMYAQTQNPNPLYPVFNPAEVEKLLQRALYEALYSVMMSYRNAYPNTINENTINGMFRYIWEQQLNTIQACLQRSI